MKHFASASYKHEQDQRVLERLSSIILVLKLAEQKRLEEYKLSTSDIQAKRADLIDFISKLQARLSFLENDKPSEDVDLAFTGLATRFVRRNPKDVADRIEDYKRLRNRLVAGESLREHDFQLLDQLQALLEQEATASVRSLYRF